MTGAAGTTGTAWSQGNKNIWLGAFGERWVDLLCSETGLICAPRPDPDIGGSDRYIENQDIGEIIRAQVKTTEYPSRTAAGYSFPLDVRTYHRLRTGNTRGYLFLIVLHQLHPGWVRHFPGRGSLTRASGFWAKITGMPDVATQTVTVSLPDVNVLVPDTLAALMNCDADG